MRPLGLVYASIEAHNACDCGMAPYLQYDGLRSTTRVSCRFCGYEDEITDEEQALGLRLARCECGASGPVCWSCQQVKMLFGPIVEIRCNRAVLP